MFLKNLKSSFFLLFGEWKRVVSAVVLDVLFLFTYGLITAPLFSKILDYGTASLSFIAENAGEITREYSKNPSFIQLLSSNPQLKALGVNLLLLFVVLAFVVFIIYCLFQSFSWRLSSVIAGRKPTMYDYTMRFIKVTIPFFLLFMVIHILSFLHSLARISSERQDLPVTSKFLIWILILSFIMIYFSSIAYSLIAKKEKGALRKAFVIGTKQAHRMLPYFAVIIIVFLFLNLILTKLQPYYSVFIILGIVLVFPAITWARVLINIAVNRVCFKE